MKITLLAPKPSVASLYVEALFTARPELRPEDVMVGYHNPTVVHRAMAYPRGRRLREYPMVLPIGWKAPHHLYENFFPAVDVMPEAEDDRQRFWGRQFSMHEFMKFLSESDEIIAVVDKEPRSCMSACQVLETFRGTEREGVHVAFLEHPGYPDVQNHTPSSLLGCVMKDEEVVRRTRIQLNKMFFDFNYNLNSFAVMGLTASRVLDRTLNTAPTKNVLQLLYVLRDHVSKSDGELVDMMSRWKGTGRYPECEIGSPESSAGIIHEAIQLGFATRVSNNSISLTEDGEGFLEALHPDCRDPDQTARLREWCLLDQEEAEARIGRYIRTYFGKQIRFMNRHSSLGHGAEPNVRRSHSSVH